MIEARQSVEVAFSVSKQGNSGVKGVSIPRVASVGGDPAALELMRDVGRDLATQVSGKLRMSEAVGGAVKSADCENGFRCDRSSEVGIGAPGAVEIGRASCRERVCQDV